MPFGFEMFETWRKLENFCTRPQTTNWIDGQIDEHHSDQEVASILRRQDSKQIFAYTLLQKYNFHESQV